MPKNQHRNRGSKATGRVAGYLEDKVCLAQGRTYVTNTSISQYAEIALTPVLLGDRAVAVADIYALWRPKSIRFRALSLGGAAVVCIGHLYPNEFSASITTMEEFVDLPACKFGNGLFGAPLPDLLLEEPYWRANRMTEWYTTSTAPTDDLLEKAGVLIYGNATSTMTTHNFLGVVEWELEFKCMLDPTVSLNRMELRLRNAPTGVSEHKFDEGYVTCQDKSKASQSDVNTLVPCPRGVPPPNYQQHSVVARKSEAVLQHAVLFRKS